MEQTIKKVLKKIENNGYEAYLVGGYVRDFIVGKSTYDIDICTNALPKELNRIFPKCINNKYGGINFKIKKYNFDITTYRKELQYNDRKPTEIEYINNLFEDINRRDFKINAICMDSKGFIIDLLQGMKDIDSRIISTIGDSAVRFQEDPLRMLRAIRFMTILDFNLDDEIKLNIEKYKKLLLEIPINRIKEEFDKILISDNVMKGLSTLKEFGILDLLNISYKNIIIVKDLTGMWAQLNFEFNSAFTKEEKNNIINIRKILEFNRIDESVLFNYGLYQSTVAGAILGIDKVDVNQKYRKLPIHNKNDVKITYEDLKKILNLEPSEKVSIIMSEIIDKILKRELKNSASDIRKYLLDKKEKWL